jgi:DNA-binding response OmpR family regulator
MAGTNGGRRKVLVVEDDDAIVRVLRLSLRNNGYETARACSGSEALKSLDEYRFDAVILDLCLPDKRGGEVLHRLQSVTPTIPWIVMSAMDEGDAVKRFGPIRSPYLAKPFDLWDLIRTLDEMLDRNATGYAQIA